MPAFQAIGSVVHVSKIICIISNHQSCFFFIVIFFKAFGSISMMLESSFHAVHSSFQVETMK